MPLSESAAGALGFVIRCSGGATIAYVGADAVGLPHPVWAMVSALIVSQDQIGDTKASLNGRVIGSIIGITAGVGVNLALSPVAAPLWAQIAVSVTLCAVVAHYRPQLRVCMWTGPIVLLTAEPGTPIAIVGFYRGSEVILGAAVGAVLHWITERIVASLFATSRRSLNTKAGP
jgi:uncharacterized membrane protein YccC